MAQAFDKIDLQPNARADRLGLRFRGAEGDRSVWLTRRLVKALLSRFTAMMARGADSSGGDAGESLMVFEHLEALDPPAEDRGGADAGSDDTADASAGTGARVGPAPDAETGALIEEINIRRRGRSFELEAVPSEGERIALTVGRDEMHRLLAAVFRASEALGWDLAESAGWLARAQRARPHHSLQARH